jgi:VanZ family protein
VSDLQPWRNPRPSPRLPEIEPRIGRFLMPPWLRAWWPALLWAGVIFLMSTDTFSAEHTGSILEPVLRWFLPSLTAGQFALIHYGVRKTAHFTEYFVFALLLYRGVRSAHKGWRWSWALTALFIAAGYSALDEIHQAFVVSRTASPYDSLLDSAGAFVAIAVLWLWFRTRKPTPFPAPELS